MPFSWNIYILVVLRCLDGFFAHAIYATLFLIALEMVGPSKRHILGALVPLAYDMGSFILVFPAFFLRDWRWLQLVLSSPMVISVFYWWKAVLPESPRWLISRGRTNKAIRIIKEVARKNTSETSHISSINIDHQSKESMMVILKNLFTSETLVKRLIVILIDWFVLAFIYFGVTLNLGFLGEDLYITFLMNAIVETLGNCLQFLLNKTGRRKMFLACLFSMSLFFIASVCTDMFIHQNNELNWITVALTMIGKLMISLGYGLIYVYTGELFPTVVRGGVMGLCTLSASAGSLITPYLYTLAEGKLRTSLPLMLYAAATFIAAVSSTFLPETTNIKLQDRINNEDDIVQNPDDFSCDSETMTKLVNESDRDFS